jgi:shikimate dehydrogenase
MRDLEVNLGWGITDANILLLGAGGAMRGIVSALCEQIPRSIHVANRTTQRAFDLIRLFEGRGKLTASGLDAIPETPWDLVINGLSSGWQEGFPDIAIPALAATASAYDLIYSDQPTAFIQWSDNRGFKKTSDGLGMLIEQAADSYAIWHGERPETAGVLADLRT